MFNWKKLGLIFDPTRYPDRPWLREFAQAPATLVFRDFIRVYFSCRPNPNKDGTYVSNSAYVDLDRSDIRRIIRVAEQPVMERGAVGQFDEFGIYPVSPIRMGNEIWLYYGGWTRCESVPFNVAIGLAKSSDEGDTFQRHGPGPILSYSLHEPFVLSGPKIRYFNGLYYLFYISGTEWIIDQGRPEPVYKIRMASSKDGLTWQRLGRNLVPDSLGTEEAQASPDVHFANGRYHMFFCYRQGRDYRTPHGGYRIGYAHSADLLTWTREDHEAGLRPSADGWDSETVSYPHVLSFDGSTYLFYLGNSVGRWGFGAAKLTGDNV